MEDTLKKVINIGIGAVKTFQENYGDRFKDWEQKLEASLDKFEKTGAKAEDKMSTKIREGIDEFMNFVGKYQSESHEEAKPKKKTTKTTKKTKKTDAL